MAGATVPRAAAAWRVARARPARTLTPERRRYEAEMSGEIAIIQSRTVEEPNCPIADRAPRRKSQKSKPFCFSLIHKPITS